MRGPASGGAVVVAASTTDLEDTLHALRVGVVLSALGAAALGAAAVALLLGRAFRPLRRLASSAAEIERTADPGRRLPETGVDDEVGRLATTLNAMLGSLERSREAQHRLVADASHELRTPLTALQGNVAYLARHGATPELVTDLQEGTDRLVRLAGDLIAISREEAAAPPADDVALDRLVASLADGDPQVVAVAEPVRVRGDGAALERAISNLLQNARLHGPAEGAITLTVAAVGRPGARLRLRRGAGSRPCRQGAGVRAFLAWRSRPLRLRPRPRDRACHRRTARREGVRRRFLLHDRAPGSQRTLQRPVLHRTVELSEEGSP